MAIGGKLTEQQENFSQEYIIDMDPVRAASAAYPSLNEKDCIKKATELMGKFKILNRIQELKSERRDRLRLSQESVLQKIAEVVDRCMQAVPVMINGIHTGEFRFDASAALKGLELYGKHLAMWTDRLQVSDPITELLAKKLDTLTTEDLVELSKWAKSAKTGDRIDAPGIRVTSGSN